MWIEKLRLGVLRVITPMGPRYIRPEISQRVYLLWIFRHFEVLPLQVLSARQQKLIDALCSEHRLHPHPAPLLLADAPVLGTVEWRPRPNMEQLPARRPAAGTRVAAGMAARVGQRS
jgi:hypothetical protein